MQKNNNINVQERSETSVTDLWNEFAQTLNQQTFNEIYRRTAKGLYNYLKTRYSINPETTKDLVQDTFSKTLYRGIKDHEQNNPLILNNFWGYIVIMARNIYLNDQRKAKRILLLTDEVKNPLDIPDKTNIYPSLDFQTLSSILEEKLNERDLKLINLTFQGYSNQEIGVKLDKPSGWVRRRKSEAFKKARNILSDSGLI